MKKRLMKKMMKKGREFKFSLVGEIRGGFIFITGTCVFRRKWHHLIADIRNYLTDHCDIYGSTVILNSNKQLDFDRCGLQMDYTTDDCEHIYFSDYMETEDDKMYMFYNGYRVYPMYSTDEYHGAFYKFSDGSWGTCERM